MNCEQAQELLSRRLDGDLTEKEAALLQAHLEQCPACRETSQYFIMAQDAMCDMQIEPPAVLHDSVMQCIHRETSRKKSKSLIPAVSIVAAAAAVAILAGAGLVELPGFSGTAHTQTNILEILQDSADAEEDFASQYANETHATVLAIWAKQIPDALRDAPYTEENGGKLYAVSLDTLRSLAANPEGVSRAATYTPDGTCSETEGYILLFKP